MRTIEDKVHDDSQGLIEKNRKYSTTSSLLLFSMLLVSIVTVILVTLKAIHIEDKLRLLSATDELTGISNRRSFNEKLHKAWKSASRCGKPLTVLMVDIDHFKSYNDYYGHQKGDECLIRVARLMWNDVHRSGDIVARYGGEEFAIAILNVDESGAKVVAERLLDLVRAERIPHEASGSGQYVSISIGYASMTPTRGSSSEDLIKVADDALYESKRAGRNRANCAICDEPFSDAVPVQV